jgi:ubiquinone/menaquinone biosynthesis C-methylase UbiE
MNNLIDLHMSAQFPDHAAFAYGQQEPMENEAMARTLDAQARAIWPQERDHVRRVFTRPGLEVLDVGCGTGEISSRVFKEFVPKNVTGLDISEANLIRAKKLYPRSYYSGLNFELGNAMQMHFRSASFDAS